MMECNDMKVGNVGQQIDRLRNTISSLRSAADVLVQKINPVLLEPQVQPPTTAAPTEPYQPLSPVFEELRMLEQQVESIITTLDDVIKRVDL
jgi:hypothetical protein